MRGRIIMQQAPGLEHVQIWPHARDTFQQLVEHTFVEVPIHHLPQRNKLSMNHPAHSKTAIISSSRAIFATAVFVISETLGPSIPHSVVSSWVEHETLQFVPRHNCGQKRRVTAMHRKEVFARGHTVCFLLRR